MDTLAQFIDDLAAAAAKGDEVAFIDCNPADFTYDPSYGQMDSALLLKALLTQQHELAKLKEQVKKLENQIIMG